MTEKKKRVPGRATLKKNAYGRVAKAEEEVARRKAAQLKAIKKHDVAVALAENELADAEQAFAKFSAAPGQQESPDA